MGLPQNGAGAVDLAAIREQSRQRAELKAKRPALIKQLLEQAAMQCGCGERIRDHSVVYVTIIDGPVMTADGPQPGLSITQHICCSETCEKARALAAVAIARRDGPGGAITWADEQPAEREQ